MSHSPQALNDLLGLVEKRERAARWRVVVFSAIPVALAGALLWFTGQRIRSAEATLDSVNTKLTEAQTKLTEAENKSTELTGQLTQAQEQLTSYSKQIDELRKQLGQAIDYRRKLAPTNPMMLAKYLAIQYPRQVEVFENILQLQGQVSWKPGGFSAKDGFDSPSFAAYMLERHRLLQRPASEVRYSLRDALRPKEAPEVGDLVFYSLGYAMFFYRDDQQRPFVLGMTPFGILALRADFAPIMGYAGVPYGR